MVGKTEVCSTDWTFLTNWLMKWLLSTSQRLFYVVVVLYYVVLFIEMVFGVVSSFTIIVLSI